MRVDSNITVYSGMGTSAYILHIAQLLNVIMRM